MSAEELPDLDAEEEVGEQDPEVWPFYSIRAQGGTSVRVRAGWLTENGDVDSLIMDFNGPLGQTAQAQQLALEWYADTINHIIQQNAENGDGAEQ